MGIKVIFHISTHLRVQLLVSTYHGALSVLVRASTQKSKKVDTQYHQYLLMRFNT